MEVKKMNEKQKKKEKRDNVVHIAFTKSWKKHIKAQAKTDNMTISEFVRQAVFEKMRREEFPEQFKQTNIDQIDPNTLEEIKRYMEKSIELEEEIKDRLKIAENIESITKAIKDQYNKLKKENLISGFSKESNLIVDLFKTHKSLTPDQISKLINLDIDDVLLILNTSNRFKLNIITGKYELR